MVSDNISKQVIKYWKIFALLLFCTVLTVLAVYVDFDVEGSIAGGIFIGLTIAVFKGYLVAYNFMHLNDEKPMVYWIILVTLVFFLILLFIPVIWESTLVGKY